MRVFIYKCPCKVSHQPVYEAAVFWLFSMATQSSTWMPLARDGVSSGQQCLQRTDPHAIAIAAGSIRIWNLEAIVKP